MISVTIWRSKWKLCSNEFYFSDTSCLTLENCSPNADCTWIEGTYECECSTGYTGDGYTCTPITSNTPKCIFGVCICPKGYIYHGMNCTESISNKYEIYSPKAVPECYGTSCACPKGYKFNNSTQICQFTNIPVPAQGTYLIFWTTHHFYMRYFSALYYI